MDIYYFHKFLSTLPGDRYQYLWDDQEDYFQMQACLIRQRICFATGWNHHCQLSCYSEYMWVLHYIQTATKHKGLKMASFAYFGMKLGDWDKPWTPHSFWWVCVQNLRASTNMKKKSLGFDFSVVWMEPQNHFDDCCFYLVNLSGYSTKTKQMNIWNLPFVLACLMTEKSVMVCCLEIHNILVIRTLKINLLVANLFPCYSHTQSWIT